MYLIEICRTGFGLSGYRIYGTVLLWNRVEIGRTDSKLSGYWISGKSKDDPVIFLGKSYIIIADGNLLNRGRMVQSPDIRCNRIWNIIENFPARSIIIRSPDIKRTLIFKEIWWIFAELDPDSPVTADIRCSPSSNQPAIQGANLRKTVLHWIFGGGHTINRAADHWHCHWDPDPALWSIP